MSLASAVNLSAAFLLPAFTTRTVVFLTVARRYCCWEPPLA